MSCKKVTGRGFRGVLTRKVKKTIGGKKCVFTNEVKTEVR